MADAQSIEYNSYIFRFSYCGFITFFTKTKQMMDCFSFTLQKWTVENILVFSWLEASVPKDKNVFHFSAKSFSAKSLIDLSIEEK